MRRKTLLRKVKSFSDVHLEVRTYIAEFISLNSKPRSRFRQNKPDQNKTMVFSYWAQGEIAAPELVKNCIKSHREIYGSDYVLLDDTTLGEYIDIPEIITLKRSVMSNTHYSDVVRLLLLKKYGGTWIDATVFLTGKLKIEQGSLFAFSRANDPYILSVWFIWVNGPDNYLIRCWLESLINYWDHHDSTVDYFVLHFLFESNFHRDRKFRRIWQSRQVMSYIEPHILQSMLLDEFDLSSYEKVLGESKVHKLTWKLPAEVPTGSLLEYMLKK